MSKEKVIITDAKVEGKKGKKDVLITQATVEGDKELDEQLPMRPNTTAQQDKTYEGQRAINLIWENTQSRIALFVVVVGVLLNAGVVFAIIFWDRDVTVNQLALISVCLQFINLTTGIVIGFYFSRTNHTKTGGTGNTPVDDAR